MRDPFARTRGVTAFSIKDTALGFGPVTKTIHWVLFALVASLFALGWYMVGLPNTPEKFQIYALHKSIGVTVLMGALIRVVWRFTNPTPPILGAPKRWQRIGARAVHGLLYLGLLVIPLSGWTLACTADFPPSWFGWFEIPCLVAPDDATREIARIVHRLLGRGLLVLVLVHVGAALHHHLAKRDRTLLRMLPGGDAHG